ncbi:MAG: FAD-binding protein [Dehalococcoidia bacterium]|nr:FAD-binding protein [Dehalococcoidia bacterium]
MKISVCVKWVPVVARMKFDLETRTIVREGVPSELNAYDQLAVQWAVDHKQQYNLETHVYTMGPPPARQGLVQCLAMGADDAHHIVDPALAGSDTLATARALSLALAKGNYDLLLFGAHSVDAETGQVGPEVAEMLGLSQVTGVHSIEVLGPEKVRVEREVEDGVEVIECLLPAVVSVVEGIAPEVFPGREETRAAQERPIAEISATDLSADLSVFGASGSPTWVADIQFIESNREQRVIAADLPTADTAREVASYLREKGLLDPAVREQRRASAPLAPGAARTPDGAAVWVLADHGADGLRSVTRELLGAAGGVADAIDGHVVGVLMGAPNAANYAAEIGRAGADLVAVAADEALADYTTEAYADTLARAMAERRPYAVLLPSTVNGRDLAARVAAKLGLGLTGDCVGLEVDDEGRLVQLKPAFGGNIVAPILSRTKPYMATVRPGILAPLRPNDARVVETVALPVATPENPAVRVIERRAVEQGETADLEDAWSVVAVGMGVGSEADIARLRPLTDALGAELICTRDVVEAGWMPRQRQVGLTGRSVAPALYIGVGVRGDFNHTVGIQRAGTVIVVNSNRRAQFFRACDLGVIADWNDFIPALVAELTGTSA